MSLDGTACTPRSPAFEGTYGAVRHSAKRVCRSFLLLVPAIILTLWARGWITENLPWEILELICDESDDITQEDFSRETADRYFASHPVPRPEEEAELASIDVPPDCHVMTWSDIPLKKHRRNKLILSMSQVCRSWRVRMIGLKRVWREIAFDIEMEPASIHLAALFLNMVEGDDVPIQIYARFTFGDLPDPTVGSLLSKLREQTHRWETFSYWGRLGPYRSYLDLPAPALRNFSDNHDLSCLSSGQTTLLFAGHVPILQSLVTSALGSWQPTKLIHLKTLDLWDCNARLSIGSLLNSLRCTPQLEEINIISPNLPIHDCPHNEVVSLPRLKDIKVQNPDFYSIVGHLAIPNVQAMAVYSIYTRGDSNLQIGPAFRTAHTFVGFTSMEIPLLTQAVLVASFDVQHTLSGFTFTISFITEKKASFCVLLEWAGGVGISGWVEYIERSIAVLARMDFRPGATLQVRMDHCTINHSPLLRLGAIEYYSVECRDLSKTLEILSCCQAPLLPNLKSLFAQEVELDEEAIKPLLNFLQSRRHLIASFYDDSFGDNKDVARMFSDYCVVEGELVSEIELFSTQLKPLFIESITQVPNLDGTPWPCIHIRLKN